MSAPRMCVFCFMSKGSTCTCSWLALVGRACLTGHWALPSLPPHCWALPPWVHVYTSGKLVCTVVSTPPPGGCVVVTIIYIEKGNAHVGSQLAREGGQDRYYHLSVSLLKPTVYI